MRRRRLKKLWRRLHALQEQRASRDALLLKLGRREEGSGPRLSSGGHPPAQRWGKSVSPQTFTFSLRLDRLRQARRREGRCLLRSNLTGEDPATLWRYYMRLTEIEQAFKELKHDLAIRPVFHQREDRIEAHIFIAFIAYCLQVTLKNLAKPCAPGTGRRGAILEKFRHDADGRHASADHRRAAPDLAHATRRPSADHQLLLDQLKTAFVGAAVAENHRPRRIPTPVPTAPCSADL